MEDIAPGLVADVTEEFQKLYEGNSKIQTLLGKVRDGSATYAEAQTYSLEVSDLISAAYRKNISSAVLPDGRMYYNIASRLIPSTMDENYSLVSDYAAAVQKSLNEKAKIGIKVQVPEENRDRVDGLVEMVSNAEQYDQVSGKLFSGFENFCLNIVDESIKANAEFQSEAGLKPKIIRKAERKCCEWCANLAGEYEYPDVPHDVYRRHANCRCRVTYDPADGKGKYQDVWTKKWTEPEEHDIIEQRKRLHLRNTDTFRPKEYENTVRGYVKVDRENALAAAKSGGRHCHSGVYMEAMAKTKKQLQKSIISHTSQVERHADKMKHPELYAYDWPTMTVDQQAGLLRKWEKDMRRNAEQAEIELAVFEKRF